MSSLNKLLISIGLVIALVFAEYHFYFKSKFAQENALKKDLFGLNQEIESIRPKDIDNIRQEAGKLNFRIPIEEDLPYVIKDLVDNKNTNLKIDYEFLRPQAIISELNYKKMPIDIGFSTSPFDFLAYLNKIENMRPLIKIDTIEFGQESVISPVYVKMSASVFLKSKGPSIYLRETIEPTIDRFPKIAAKRIKRKIFVKLPRFKGTFKGVTTKAFVDDSILGIGDSINGFIVSEINDDSIIVLKSDKSYTLKLGR